MITASEFIDLVEESAAAIRAAIKCSTPDSILWDGSQYSPSDRVLPNGEFIFQNGDADQWETFQDEMQEIYNGDAYWEEGILWRNEAI